MNPISGPTITRPIEEIKDVLKENTFICVKETPKDINIKTIIVQPNNITEFVTNFGISRSKYRKATAIITAYEEGLFKIILKSNFLLAKKMLAVKCKRTTKEDIAAATPIPKDPYANRQIGIPILPVLGRKKGGNSIEISFFMKNKNMTPVIAKQDNAITEYIKYSENTLYVTPEDVIAKINRAGAPKLAE